MTDVRASRERLAATVHEFATRYAAVPSVEIELRFGRWDGRVLHAGIESLDHALFAEYARRRFACGFRCDRSDSDVYVAESSAEQRARYAITGDVHTLVDRRTGAVTRRAKRLLSSRVLVDDAGALGFDVRLVAAVEIDIVDDDDAAAAGVPSVYSGRRRRRRESYTVPGVRVDVSVVDTEPADVRTHELEIELATPLPAIAEIVALLDVVATPRCTHTQAARVLAMARRAVFVPATPDRTAFMPMPHTLRRQHARSITASTYVATDKADGRRALLVVVAHEGAYLVEHPSLRVRLLRGRAFVDALSTSNAVADGDATTVLDGELVDDAVTGALVYLAFDATLVDGDTVATAPLASRLAAVERDVMPALAAYTGADCFAFAFALKRYFPLEDARAITAFATGATYTSNDVSRHVDGVIFAPTDAPYISSTPTFKWKSAAHATVDMLYDPRSGRLLVATDDARVHATIAVVDGGERAHISSMVGGVPAIVECRYDTDTSSWRFVRVRSTKTTPNHASTLAHVLASQAEALTLDEVLAHSMTAARVGESCSVALAHSGEQK